jgi:hypothetical protein
MIDGGWRVLDLVGYRPHGRRLVSVPHEHFPGRVQNAGSRLFPLAGAPLAATHGSTLRLV